MVEADQQSASTKIKSKMSQIAIILKQLQKCQLMHHHNYGIGAALLQQKEAQWQPVAMHTYAFWSMTDIKCMQVHSDRKKALVVTRPGHMKSSPCASLDMNLKLDQTVSLLSFY